MSNAKQSLREFAGVLKSDPTLDIAIIGHTDKVGTQEANQKVPNNRAYAVENYLQSCGVQPSQFKTVEGVGYSQYDESLTAAQNRRVEVYMYASEQMIKMRKPVSKILRIIRSLLLFSSCQPLLRSLLPVCSGICYPLMVIRSVQQ